MFPDLVAGIARETIGRVAQGPDLWRRATPRAVARGRAELGHRDGGTPKADHSVATTWGHDGEAWLLVDLVRVRLPYPELLAKIRFERSRWRSDTILVERAFTGGPLLDDLARDMRGLSEPQHHARGCQRIAMTPTVDKEKRLAVGVERLYSGKARFPTAAA